MGSHRSFPRFFSTVDSYIAIVIPFSRSKFEKPRKSLGALVSRVSIASHEFADFVDSFVKLSKPINCQRDLLKLRFTLMIQPDNFSRLRVSDARESIVR